MNMTTLTTKELKKEYDQCIARMNQAESRKEIIYWCRRSTELMQVMDNRESYCLEYSGIC